MTSSPTHRFSNSRFERLRPTPAGSPGSSKSSGCKPIADELHSIIHGLTRWVGLSEVNSLGVADSWGQLVFAGTVTTLSETTANRVVLNWADITTRLLMDSDVPM